MKTLIKQFAFVPSCIYCIIELQSVYSTKTRDQAECSLIAIHPASCCLSCSRVSHATQATSQTTGSEIVKERRNFRQQSSRLQQS